MWLAHRDRTLPASVLPTAGIALAAFLGAGGAAGAQVRPPVIANAAPYGIQRGTTTTITVDGTNLGNADEVLFSDPGLSARILSFADFGPDVPVRRPEDTGPPISDQAQKTVVDHAMESAGALGLQMKQAEALIQSLRRERSLAADLKAAVAALEEIEEEKEAE